MPPATSTLPFGRSVAVWYDRALLRNIDVGVNVFTACAVEIKMASVNAACNLERVDCLLRVQHDPGRIQSSPEACAGRHSRVLRIQSQMFRRRRDRLRLLRRISATQPPISLDADFDSPIDHL